MGLAQSFAAVGQVQTHRRTRGIGVLTGNRVVDFLVLAAQAAHVVLLVIMSQTRRVQPRTWNDAGAKVGHDVGEVAVAGGQGDFQVESEVRRHRIAGMGGAFVQGVEGGAHGCQLLGAAALRGKAGGFDFEADAQFEDRQHVTQGDHGGRIDTETARARRIENKGADAVAGFT